MADPTVRANQISLPRGSFSFEQREAVAQAYPSTAAVNRQGQRVNLAHTPTQRLARRHVVSSHDMATHYVSSLTGKKVSQGKLLLEERGSIAEARSPVPTLTVAALQTAATARYDRFFGYLRNLFVGDSRENSAIQERLDPHHPRMQSAAALDAHVRHVKRAWALDQGMPVSGLNQT